MSYPPFEANPAYYTDELVLAAFKTARQEILPAKITREEVEGWVHTVINATIAHLSKLDPSSLTDQELCDRAHFLVPNCLRLIEGKYRDLPERLNMPIDVHKKIEEFRTSNGS